MGKGCENCGAEARRWMSDPVYPGPWHWHYFCESCYQIEKQKAKMLLEDKARTVKP